MRPVNVTTPLAGGLLTTAGAGAIALAAAEQAVRLGRLLEPERWGTVDPSATLEAIVAVAVLATGALLAAWYAVTGLAVAACGIATWSGRSWRSGEAALRRWGAPFLRRLGGVAVGVAVGAALGVTGAAAVPVEAPDDLRWGPAAGSRSVESPDRPPETPPTTTRALPVQHASHVVLRGESLWSIAAAALAADGADSSDRAVAQEWPRWYEANASVIGADPDLILPGQELARPVQGARP